MFLADRLLITPNIWTLMRAGLEIDTPRPRRLADSLTSERANQIKMEALSILHEEAMKPFSRGSKAPADFAETYTKRIAK